MKIDHANNLWPPIADIAAASILSTFQDLKETIDLQVNKQNFFGCRELELMIRRVWKLLRPQIEEKDAHLSLNLTVPVINYVKVYLENILFNLTRHPITYTRSGVVPGKGRRFTEAMALTFNNRDKNQHILQRH